MLANTTMLVTGAGTGIGAAVVASAIGAGANVVLMGRRRAPLEAIAAPHGDRAVVVEGDAARGESVRSAVALATARFGGLDSVVACAGTVDVGRVGDTSDAVWREQLSTNLDTAFVTARECIPTMIARGGGAFVFLSSLAGLQAIPQSAAYVVAKHAIIGLARSIAVDYGAEGIRANAVCPGWVETPMADSEMQVVADRDGITLAQAYALMSADVPARRAAKAEEIASLCCYLASPRSAFVNGTYVTADGGASAVCVPTLRG
ncbi:NAD(P)-dependent dehydrogenase (short-subunit alcohol dehydrogenase family) [Novosphingobium sp. 1529]|uniref:SDR family NAD(P)-dependent oxidoreductase n=1 Tax=Novosphingobium sp. 1529 TaxID=3156424 RepID=UPI00145B23B9